MPYYKDTAAKVHFIDDEAFFYLLPPGCAEITPSEAAALTAYSQSPNEVLINSICKLEETITQRRLREALLGKDNGWLANVEAEIDALRKQLT